MKLVVVESPTKAKTLSKFLGKEYQVEASMGHVRDLPQRGGGMAIDVENDFKPNYEVIEAKRKHVTELKKIAKNAKTVILATDLDREGEAIAYHVAYLLGKHDYQRVTFHEITQSAIESAIAKPGKLNMKLVHAQQARRVLDRLVGYTLSPVLWRKVRRGLSAGRVQSVAVRLIVEREAEIKAFNPVEYWEIFVDLKGKGGAFRSMLIKRNGKRIEIGDGKESGKVVSDLRRAKYVVSDLVEKKKYSSPPPPFTTSTLQQMAARVMGWSSKKTMSTAQALYERGHITYHRTDSVFLANEAVKTVRQYIEQEYGEEYVPSSARFYKTKSKSAQEAHEAVRPTNPKTLADDLKGKKMLSAQQKLYRLIRNRFLQCQMSDASYDRTDIFISTFDKVYLLEAKGKRLIFDGWMRLGKLGDDEILPKVEVGEKLNLKKVDPLQKFSKPPARYSEASLIKELEKRGIGRPSTYASIISTIQDRMYVVKEERRFQPTVIGGVVTKFLIKNFGDVMAYEFTAEMEDDLDAIAEGKKEWVEVVGRFWKPFKKKAVSVEKEAERVKIPVEKTGKKCPTCKKNDVVVRTGKYGKFYSCSSYPDCDYTKQYTEYVKGIRCPECKGRVVERRSRKGAKFFGCEKYPKCKWATWRLPKKQSK